MSGDQTSNTNPNILPNNIKQDPIYSYTAHVLWQGYTKSEENNCGTGINNPCEIKMQVKNTVSKDSCSNRAVQETAISLEMPNRTDMSKNIELSWTNTGSAPCLTFDVKFVELQIGPTTNEYTYTISSNGGISTTNIYSVLGSGIGYYQIKYWLTNETISS